MTRTASTLVLIALALAPPGCHRERDPDAPVIPVKQDPSLEPVGEHVLTEYFRHHPVAATAAGDHRFDHHWPDLSPQGLAADARRIDDALARLDALARRPEPLRTDDRVDLAILRNALAYQRFVHEVERPWARDPYWYVQLVGEGLRDLVAREFAPLDVRASAATSRIEGIPALIDRALETLEPSAAMTPHTEVAITQTDGLLELIAGELTTAIAQAPAPTRTRFEAAAPQAEAALVRFREHLQAEVLPHAAGAWRLGPEAFERKLRLTLQSELPAAEIRRLAILEHGRVRQRMAALARELATVLFTASALRTFERRTDMDPDAALTRAVLTELAAAHPPPDALRDHIETTLAHLDAFVTTRAIVPLDDREVLRVIWTPAHARGVFVAGLAAPGPLEAVVAGLPSFYLVQPIPEAWSPEKTESYLREYNHFMLEVLSIHEAIPGHFVQLYYGKNHTSKVRRVLQNGAFVEGWAVYAEQVLMDQGYAGSSATLGPDRPEEVPPGVRRVLEDDSLRAQAIALHRLKFYLRTITNAILDHDAHAGDLSREGALELMIERSFQELGEAESKWTRVQLTSTQLSTYFVGTQAWLRLRARAEARSAEIGESFDLAAFHEAALSHGAPPVSDLPALLGWDPGSSGPARPLPPSGPTDP